MQIQKVKGGLIGVFIGFVICFLVTYTNTIILPVIAGSIISLLFGIIIGFNLMNKAFKVMGKNDENKITIIKTGILNEVLSTLKRYNKETSIKKFQEQRDKLSYKTINMISDEQD